MPIETREDVERELRGLGIGRLGAGVNSASGTEQGRAIDVQSHELLGFETRSQNYFDCQVVSTQESAFERLGVSASARYKTPVSTFSARAEFARSVESTANSVILIARRIIRTRSVFLLNPQLNPAAKELSDKLPDDETGQRFVDVFGDHFVKEQKYGGELFVVLRLEAATYSEAQALSVHLNAKVGLFSGAASLSHEIGRSSKTTNVSLSAYYEGADRKADLSLLSTSIDVSNDGEKLIRFASIVDNYHLSLAGEGLGAVVENTLARYSSLAGNLVHLPRKSSVSDKLYAVDQFLSKLDLRSQELQSYYDIVDLFMEDRSALDNDVNTIDDLRKNALDIRSMLLGGHDEKVDQLVLPQLAGGLPFLQFRKKVGPPGLVRVVSPDEIDLIRGKKIAVRVTGLSNKNQKIQQGFGVRVLYFADVFDVNNLMFTSNEDTDWRPIDGTDSDIIFIRDLRIVEVPSKISALFVHATSRSGDTEWASVEFWRSNSA